MPNQWVKSILFWPKVSVNLFISLASELLEGLFLYLLMNEEKQFLDPPLALKGLKPSGVGYNESVPNKFFKYDKQSPIQPINGGKFAPVKNDASTQVYLQVG